MEGKNTDDVRGNPADDNVLIKERKSKLSMLKERGVNPYPYSFDKKNSAKELLQKYEGLMPEQKADDDGSIAGRIMTMRRMGKATFFHIQDETGKIQAYIRQDDIGDDAYSVLKDSDIGDIVGVKGKIFKTKVGEVTVNASEYILLTKTLQPLPEKYHGLKDVELRYRQRYVDLIMNPDVREVFRIRAGMVKAFREFLDSRGFLEVETPTLQPQYGGASARPFETHHNALNMKLYLRISNELYLKRLLVGGFEKVYEFVHDFRNEGIDTTHNPEFTQIEWYEAYTDYNHQMEMFEGIVAFAAEKVLGTTRFTFQGTEIDVAPPWRRLRMVDAIKEYAGLEVSDMDADALADYLEKNGIEYDKAHKDSRGMLISTLFEEKCEDKLIQPTFIIDHPIETTPLCKPLRSGDGDFVERFEPYINGWEIGNAYSELNDPLLQRKLLEDQVERGRGGEEETHPMDDDFIRAIEYGMPPTGGVGVGFDRIVMLFTDNPSIRDVILFPTMKPQKDE